MRTVRNEELSTVQLTRELREDLRQDLTLYGNAALLEQVEQDPELFCMQGQAGLIDMLDQMFIYTEAQLNALGGYL